MAPQPLSTTRYRKAAFDHSKGAELRTFHGFSYITYNAGTTLLGDLVICNIKIVTGFSS